MTEEIKSVIDDVDHIQSIFNHPWIQDEVTALAKYFHQRNLTPFEGALVMSRLTSTALASSVQIKEENKSES
jgi:hypothetical protein